MKEGCDGQRQVRRSHIRYKPACRAAGLGVLVLALAGISALPAAPASAAPQARSAVPDGSVETIESYFAGTGHGITSAKFTYK